MGLDSEPKTRTEKKGIDKVKSNSSKYIYSQKHIRIVEARTENKNTLQKNE